MPKRDADPWKEVERLERVLVACAIQSRGDEGAVVEIVVGATGEDLFRSLREEIDRDELSRLIDQGYDERSGEPLFPPMVWRE